LVVSLTSISALLRGSAGLICSTAMVGGNAIVTRVRKNEEHNDIRDEGRLPE
jgi:hypothetical protein